MRRDMGWSGEWSLLVCGPDLFSGYLSFRTGIPQSTLSSLSVCPRYNGVMRYKLMLLGVFVLFRVGGCDNHHLFTDYRPLDQAGMWSSNVVELKKLKTSDFEVAQLVKLKQSSINHNTCDTLYDTSTHT